MSLRSLMLIAVALLLTAGTVLVVRGWLDSQRSQVASEQPAPKAAEGPFVLVANENLPVGFFLKEGHFRWQLWPGDDIPDSYLLKKNTKLQDLVGTVVRRSFSTGEPITSDRIIKPGDRGFLAAVLQAGFRAVSIPIGAASGIAGLVFPGDRVDIILTHTLQETADGETQEHRASETVLTNVRVLALDQKVDDQDGQPKLAKTATLEVLPNQAEVLAVVRELGSLTLSLRSLAKDEEEMKRIALLDEVIPEPGPEPGKTYTWDSDASLLVPDRGADDDEPGSVVLVTRGKETEKVTFGGSSASPASE